MAKSVFDASQFKTEEGAFTYVEAHLWRNGPVCPHCGNCDQARIRKMQGKTTRLGLHKCNECRKPFTVRIGTIFESSHLALHLWLQVIHLMCASKKGISTRQIQRMLQCSMKTAWFLTQRIRAAMASNDLTAFGTGGGIVEVDETFIGRIKGAPKRRAFHHKMKVLALIDRDTGKARTMVVDEVTAKTIMPIVRANVAREAILMTDESGVYRSADKHFAGHGTTNHGAGEYVDAEIPQIHSNTVEGYFSIFKRGMKGVYQHCGEQHLHRYLAEFEFRYNNREALGVADIERAEIALRGVIGKRLTYGQANR
ncbi:IS1595 family transposase [Novosphingobium sp.]|uniref:IS1595 family transposase n=1 Tax=Novosphingobium sp. TaxID=1874826 RepID=UPI00286AC987|nr:IS1595 family transposase [Novosphingobium sp.]